MRLLFAIVSIFTIGIGINAALSSRLFSTTPEPTITWNQQHEEIPEDEILMVMVPQGRYEALIENQLGKELWDEFKRLFAAKEGLNRFMPNDIIEIEKKQHKAVRFSLHHYDNPRKGTEIGYRFTNNTYLRYVRPILITDNRAVKTFVIKTDFASDFPDFFEPARRFLLWDWNILSLLKPGDMISFVFNGRFDGDILLEMRELEGVAVKSSQYGSFTLAAWKDQRYGEFFSAESDIFMSPPGYFRVPIDYGRISSPFGKRYDPFNKRRVKMHNGIDIVAEYGAPVHAAADGVVEVAGKLRGSGNTVTIRHENGMKSIYAHLSAIYAEPGMQVKMGSSIGAVGSTGRSTSAHLHFGIQFNGKAVDPLLFTYERLWRPPFDIEDTFRVETAELRVELSDSIEHNRNALLIERLVDFTAEPEDAQ